MNNHFKSLRFNLVNRAKILAEEKITNTNCLGFLASFKKRESYSRSCRSCKGLWPSWWRFCPVHSQSQERLQQQKRTRRLWTKPTHGSECSIDRTLLTFEDNLQLVPQNVKDAVAGARLRDNVSLQPTPASILVEIIAGLYRIIHVLQEPSSL